MSRTPPLPTVSLHDTASSKLVSSTDSAAAALRSAGWTGKGVTVAVVDTGCDATQWYLGESGFPAFSFALGTDFPPGSYAVDVTGSLGVASPVDWLGADPRYVVLAVAQTS